MHSVFTRAGSTLLKTWPTYAADKSTVLTCKKHYSYWRVCRAALVCKGALQLLLRLRRLLFLPALRSEFYLYINCMHGKSKATF